MNEGFLGFCIIDDVDQKGKKELSVGRYHKGGGCTYEFLIRFYTLSRFESPRIECFSDGMKGLYTENIPLLEKLHALPDNSASLETVIEVLKRLGYTQI